MKIESWINVKEIKKKKDCIIKIVKRKFVVIYKEEK